MIVLSKSDSINNFRAFIWHSAFLALARNFMDMDTIIPSMLIKAGGNSIHLGLLTAIMLGGSSLFQIFFASYLSNKSTKRKYLLTGINLRITALFLMAALFVLSAYLDGWMIILLIFLFISMFSFSGSFANVSYVDILGKAVHESKRKKFFSLRQVIESILLFGSALLVRYLVDYYEYPVNYSILFFAAAFLLLTASLGFWNIREPESPNITKHNFLEFFSRIPVEIRQNTNLKYYLILINTLGLGLSILPFFILLAKDNFGLSFQSIGNFLVFRTIGMLAAGLFLYRYSRKFLYKDVLKFIIILAALLPLISLLMVQFPDFYTYIFILSGIFFSLYKIILNAVLLEISTHENRAIYTGISGAGNIITTIFPVFAGFFISFMGYEIVFIFISLIIFTGYYSVLKMRCPPERLVKVKKGE
jgi:MFS family permease